MRIYLDANVLFSAAYSDGAIRALLARLHAVGHDLCADDYVVAEARRNLELKSPDGLAAFGQVRKLVQVSAYHDDVLPPELEKLLPEKDQPVLAAAIRLHCEYLVTGDRTHFSALYGRTVAGVTVYSPRALAEALLLG